MRKSTIFIFIILCLAQVKADILLYPYNLNFEMQGMELLPAGWQSPSYNAKYGYNIMMTDVDVFSGKYCMQINRAIAKNDSMFGSFVQSIDAKRYKGKKIKLSGVLKAKCDDTSSYASLFINVQIPENKIGFHIANSNNKITSNSWKNVEIIGNVDSNAEEIDFGFILSGHGTAWCDSMNFEILEQNQSGDEPPKVLSEQELNNITTFAKLYGYIRYFYPSFEVRDADWDKIALTGIDAVEEAKNNEQLCHILNNIFLPYAPAILIYPSEIQNKPILNNQKPSNALNYVEVFWKHLGADLNKKVNDFQSELSNIYRPQRKTDGKVLQLIDISQLKGKRIRFSAFAKAEVIPPSNQVQLGIKIERTEKANINISMGKNSIIENSWKEYSIEADVPKDATFLNIGFALIGEGKAWFDDTKIEIIENGKPVDNVENPIRLADFEESDLGKLIRSWTFNPASENAGYIAIITDKNIHDGKKCLYIYSDENSRAILPKSKEIFKKEYSEGITLEMPLTLYADTLRTLPRPNPNIPKLESFKPLSFTMNIDDRHSRLAIVTILWNFLKHFAIFPNSLEYENIIKDAINQSAKANSEIKFIEILRNIAAASSDGQTQIWTQNNESEYGFPFLWRKINDKIYIIKTIDTANLKIGDEVLEINNVPILNLLKLKYQSISGNTEEWKALRALAELRVGKRFTKDNFKFKHQNGIIFENEMEREILLSELPETRPDIIQRLKDSIFYLDLTRINAKKIDENMNKFKDAKVLILDMRGYCPIPVSFITYFSKNTLNFISSNIPYFTKPDNIPSTFVPFKEEHKPQVNQYVGKLIFLVDEKTSGDAEKILAMARYYKIGTSIGQKTSGTATNLLGFDLPGNIFGSYSSIVIKSPDGEVINNKPFTPDIIVNSDIKTLREGKDIWIETAYNFIEGKLKDANKTETIKKKGKKK